MVFCRTRSIKLVNAEFFDIRVFTTVILTPSLHAICTTAVEELSRSRQQFRIGGGVLDVRKEMAWRRNSEGCRSSGERTGAGIQEKKIREWGDQSI